MWDEYVDSSPESANYHRFAWRSVIENSFGHKTFYLCAKDDAGKIKGVLPLVHMKSILFGNFMVSLPFFNYGGILCDDEITRQALLEAAKVKMRERGASFIELRHFRDCGMGMATKRHKVSMLLELQKDISMQWQAFDAKLKNQIKKAQKSELTIKIGHLDNLNDFYVIFSRNMRDLGTPVYAKVFFQNILKEFPDNTKILTVILKNKAVAAGLATWYKDIFELPWASSLVSYLPFCPNDLLYWEAIKYAIENGFKKFDFGRSSLDSGTYRFKEQWGARPIQLYWQYYLKEGGVLPEITPTNPKYQLAVKLWQRLPVWLTNIVGPRIVKDIP